MGAQQSAGAVLVARARAYDRANQLDSARAAYDSAVAALPAIADWLRLRAAGVTQDSAARQAEYAAVVTPVARGRVGWTEAQARERLGDYAGAAAAYNALGARIDALRNRTAQLAQSGDGGPRAEARDSLLAFIRSRSGTPDARAAVEIADRYDSPLTSDEERLIAHSAAVAGPPSRAASGFERVDRDPSAVALSGPERFAYGVALARLHRDSEAVVTLALVTPDNAPAGLVHQAQYQRARALVAQGDTGLARRVLEALTHAAPQDTASAAALMLLADLASDERQDDAARRAFQSVGRRFPTTALASRATFRAALIAFVAGSTGTAAMEWDALVARYPKADDATAARYWAGRAWSRAGRPRVAADRWRSVLATDPLSYYATLSAQRLHVTGTLPERTADTLAGPVPAAIDSALTRAALLSAVDMSVEARFEFDRAVREAGDAPDVLLAVGTALVRGGEAPRGVAIGWRLVERGDSAWHDARILRLVYPLLFADTLVSDARAKELDPALMAAVVRQESAFNPRAVSAVGARGLMQVMPGIGRGLARAQNRGPWDPSLLDDPVTNLALGAAHLAAFQREQGGDVVRTLAAYNAGPSRVALWSTKRGATDPEVFVERIPFVETRDYVRAIVRGRDVYVALYGL